MKKEFEVVRYSRFWYGVKDCETGLYVRNPETSRLVLFKQKEEAQKWCDEHKSEELENENLNDIVNQVFEDEKLSERLLKDDLNDEHEVDDKKEESQMYKYLICYYLNTACKDRRPEEADDVWNDLKKEEVECSYEDLGKKIAELIEIDDWIYEYEDDGEDVNTDYILGYCEDQDLGDGSIILLAVYDMSNNKYLFGDQDAAFDMATTYLSVKELTSDGDYTKSQVYDLVSLPGFKKKLSK